MTHQLDNVMAGTQVVSLVEVRGPNGSLVHPRGAVGVVTRTPAVAGENFLVRFPDGFEKSLERSQLEVLKHFKDRLGAPNSDSALADMEIGAPFNLESHIIYRCVVGSRAYGLDDDESDTDRRGIYLAPPELQWSLFGAPEQFEDNADQSCYWELQKFIIMALRANPNILECLYSPMVEKVTELGAELVAVRQHFLSQMIFQTFNGYALSQFKKMEQDLRNHGQVRPKHTMHLLRLLITGLRRAVANLRKRPLCLGILVGFLGFACFGPVKAGAATLREGHVPVRVEMHRERLLSVKRGELSWTEVDAWRKELHYDFESALAETKLPERPDYEAANLFLIKARQEMASQSTCERV